MQEFVLEVQGLTKSFGGVKALDEVDIRVKKGEIYGLVGANGSGKSTLMNILFGSSVIKATGGYEGKIYIDGEEMVISSTSQAMKLGMGMIHQEFILIPEMTVAENIKLMRENTHRFGNRKMGGEIAWLDRKKDLEESREVLKKLGFSLEGDLLVKDISVNAKQFVEIAREISKSDLKILFLDEPTAVLNEEDSRKLLKILRDLAEKGITIIFCSHRLHEICEICDRVTVIRDGVKISDYEADQMDVTTLAKDMIGYDIVSAKRQKTKEEQKAMLSFKDFSVDMPGEQLNSVNLDIMEGEIVGITSLSGHGKLAVGYGLTGEYPVRGSVFFENTTVHPYRTKETIQQGLFFLPDDRKGKGLLLEHSVRDNIVFSNLYNRKDFLKKVCGKWYVRDDKAIDEYVKKQIEQLQIKCSGPHQRVSQLSGGNQQKICIARAIAVKPKLLVALEPTRGVDVGAKEKILDMFLELNEKQGTTIVVISSEIDELRRISDRIVVLCEGKVSAILPPDASDEEFALAYTGEEESM